MFVFSSIEDLLTSELGFGLATAEPLQRAICWVLQGEPVPEHLWNAPGVADSFGNIPPSRTVAELLLLCAVRSAKTLICVAASVWMAFHVDLTSATGISLRRGERPRVSYVSQKSDLAEEAFNYLVGAFAPGSMLANFLYGKPTKDTLTIQRLDGHLITIKIAVLSAYGTSLVSKWCAGVIFDEAPRMASGADGYVLNLGQQLSAVRSRMLVGAWIMIVGSPVGAVGDVFELYTRSWQNPLQTTIVVKAPGKLMNPGWWTDERANDLLATDPDAYQSDVLANFRDVQAGLFSIESLDRCTRKTPLVLLPEAGKRYIAAMDPATRANAWTLMIAETPDDRRFNVCLVREWRGSKKEPLDPKQVLVEVRDQCAAYGITTVKSDQLAVDFIRVIAMDLGLGIAPFEFTPANHSKLYLSLVAKADSGELDLPPSPMLRRDLLNIKKVYGATAKSVVKIVLPETPDGRHCDSAPPLAILCGDHAETSTAPTPPPKPKTWAQMTEDEREGYEEKQAQFDWLFDDDVNSWETFA